MRSPSLSALCVDYLLENPHSTIYEVVGLVEHTVILLARDWCRRTVPNGTKNLSAHNAGDKLDAKDRERWERWCEDPNRIVRRRYRA
jgi:hypothetical protein